MVLPNRDVSIRQEHWGAAFINYAVLYLVLSCWKKEDAFKKSIALERTHAKDNNEILTWVEDDQLI